MTFDRKLIHFGFFRLRLCLNFLDIQLLGRFFDDGFEVRFFDGLGDRFWVKENEIGFLSYGENLLNFFVYHMRIDLAVVENGIVFRGNAVIACCRFVLIVGVGYRRSDYHQNFESSASEVDCVVSISMTVEMEWNSGLSYWSRL